jgi:hypothetical protein
MLMLISFNVLYFCSYFNFKIFKHRDVNYDSTMGMCFHVLHSSCHGSIVESTATDIIDIFPKALQTTNCPELQVRNLNHRQHSVLILPNMKLSKVI